MRLWLVRSWRILSENPVTLAAFAGFVALLLLAVAGPKIANRANRANRANANPVTGVSVRT